MSGRIRCLTQSRLEQFDVELTGDTLFTRNSLDTELELVKPSQLKYLAGLPSLAEKITQAVGVNCSVVSRNHALIRRERKNYCLYDLDTVNGTNVLSRRGILIASSARPIILEDGDIISLGGYYETEKGNVPEGIQFIFNSFTDASEKDAQTKNQALLTGYMPPYLTFELRESFLLYDALNQRKGFRGNIGLLLGPAASLRQLRLGLARLVQNASLDTLSLVYLGMHGSKGGLVELFDEGEPSSKTIDYKELFQLLSLISGKKVLLVGSCYSGAFARQKNIPPDTLIITSTTDRDICYGDFFSKTLCKLLNQEDHRVDLRQMYSRLRNHPILTARMQEPSMTGSAAELPSKVRAIRYDPPQE